MFVNFPSFGIFYEVSSIFIITLSIFLKMFLEFLRNLKIKIGLFACGDMALQMCGATWCPVSIYVAQIRGVFVL